MAYPVVVSVTPTSISSASDNHPINMPAAVGAGDLLICFIVINGTVTITTPDGWSVIQAEGTNADTFAIYGKKAVGDEDGATVDFVSASTDGRAAAQVWRITGWGGDSVANDVDAGTRVLINTETPDPPEVTAGWGVKQNLFIVCCFNAGGTGTVDSYPTSYDDNQTLTASGGASGQTCIAAASRNLTDDVDDPGTWDWSASASMGTNTIVIEPGNPGGGGGGGQGGGRGGGNGGGGGPGNGGGNGGGPGGGGGGGPGNKKDGIVAGRRRHRLSAGVL